MRNGGVVGLVVALFVAGCSSHAASSAGDAAVPGGDSAAGAVGGSAGGAGTGGGAGIGSGDAGLTTDASLSTSEGFCFGFLELVAGYFSKCDGIPLDYARSLFVSDSSCLRLAGNIAAGRLAFDGTHGATCLDALRVTLSTCKGNMSMQSTVGCEQVLTPLVPLGGACTSIYDVSVGEQCKDGGYCKKGANHACSGVCAARNPIGGACDLDTDLRCAQGATCDSQSKLCVTAPVPAGVGATCTPAGTPACADGLYCDKTGADGGATAGVCRARKTSGPCTLDSECATPVRCVGATTKTCTPPKMQGEACTPGAHECDVASHCGADGKCTSAGGAIGQPCGYMNGESTLCVKDAYCDVSLLSNVDGTCRAIKHDGDTCTGPPLQECAGDNGHCDATTHKCLSCAP